MSTRGDEPPRAVPADGAVTEPVPVVGERATPPGRRRRRRRRLVAGAAAAVLAAGAGIGVWLATSGSAPSPKGPSLEVVTKAVPVTTGTMSETVTATGTIEPAQVADLDFSVSGRVTAVDVTVGQAVTAGQTLATVAPTALQAQAAAAQEALAAAQARLAADTASGASATAVAADQATVASAQTQLTTAQKNLAAAALTSTISGEVSAVDLTVGEQVSGSATSGGSAGAGRPGAVSTGPGAATSGGQVAVVSTGADVISTTVDDTQVGQLAVGDTAEVTPTGSALQATGTLTFVGLVPQSNGGIPAYPITIAISDPPAGLYAGASAQASIVVKQLSHVVEVPTQAVTYRGPHALVMVVERSGADRAQAVTVGTTSGGMTQITQGLHAGQRVVERVTTITGATPGDHGAPARRRALGAGVTVSGPSGFSGASGATFEGTGPNGAPGG